MADICILHGFLGAGKSTFARKLARQNRTIVLNPDRWCMRLFSAETYEKNWDVCFAETVGVLWRRAAKHIAAGRSVVFDMGFWSKASRTEARRKAEEMGAGFRHYYVYAPDEVLRQRLRGREGTIAARNLENFDELKALFEAPDTDPRVNFIIFNITYNMSRTWQTTTSFADNIIFDISDNLS